MRVVECLGAQLTLEVTGPIGPVLRIAADLDPVDLVSRQADLDELFLDFYRDDTEGQPMRTLRSYASTSWPGAGQSSATRSARPLRAGHRRPLPGVRALDQPQQHHQGLPHDRPPCSARSARSPHHRDG